MRAGRYCDGQLAQEQPVRDSNHISRPDARFHAWQNNSVTYVNSPAVPIYSPCGTGARAFYSRDSSQATVAARAG